MDIFSFIQEHWFSFVYDAGIFLFYGLLLLFFFLNRKQVTWQGIVLLYKSQFGIRFMRFVAERYRPYVVVMGYVAAGAGFVGLVAISILMIHQAIQVFLAPATAAGLTVVYPGLTVPGVGVLSFSYFIISLFVIVLIHEFGHGIVAEAYKIPIENTGILLFGPIVGAFVEPNEKQLFKKPDIQQYSVLGNGAFCNFLLALVCLLLLQWVVFPLHDSLTNPAGVTFTNYFGEGYPVQKAGIVPGEIITSIDGKPVPDANVFLTNAFCLEPNQPVAIQTDKSSYLITTAESPDGTRGFIGVEGVETAVHVINPAHQWIKSMLEWIIGLFRWIFLLSFGIGLFNLLPLPITDGGRMLLLFLQSIHGKEKGAARFSKYSLFFVLLVVVLLLKWVYSLIF